MRALAIAIALAVGACAAQRASVVRTDGKPVDPVQEQATLAQCKGEGVSGASHDPNDWGRTERTLVDACMARSGYIQAQQ